jgi:hypothetical protein
MTAECLKPFPNMSPHRINICGKIKIFQNALISGKKCYFVSIIKNIVSSPYK